MGLLRERFFEPFAALQRYFWRGGSSASPNKRVTALDREKMLRSQQGARQGSPDKLFDSHNLNRIEKYAISEEMDSDPLIGIILDSYASDATQTGVGTNRVVWVETNNANVQTIIESFLDRIEVDRNAFAIIRSLAKYGDHFEGIPAARGSGISHLVPYHPSDVAILVDDSQRLLGFSPADASGDPKGVSGFSQSGISYGEHASVGVDSVVPYYSLLHFKLHSRDRVSQYGESLLSSSKENWRRLMMVEDQIVIQRLLRAPDRLLVKLKGMGMSFEDAAEAIARYERSMHRSFYIDTGNEKYVSASGVFAEHKDVVLAEPENGTLDFQQFPATNQNDLLRDLEHFLNRMFSGFGVPKGFYGFDGTFDNGRSLSVQDIRFSKYVVQLQRAFLEELHRACVIELAFNGIDPLIGANQFDLQMQPPSNYVELERAELLDTRIRLTRDFLDVGADQEFDRQLWVPYVLSEYGKLPAGLVELLMESGIEAEGEEEPFAEERQRQLFLQGLYERSRTREFRQPRAFPSRILLMLKELKDSGSENLGVLTESNEGRKSFDKSAARAQREVRGDFVQRLREVYREE